MQVLLQQNILCSCFCTIYTDESLLSISYCGGKNDCINESSEYTNSSGGVQIKIPQSFSRHIVHIIDCTLYAFVGSPK